MIAGSVKEDPQSDCWSRVVATYVGEDRPLSVAEFERQIRSFQAEHGYETANIRPRIRNRITRAGLVEAATAWEEGQVLRQTVPWVSGLLALFASGHYFEATGVIGLSQPDISCDRLLAMINQMGEALYSSCFDDVLLRAPSLPIPRELGTLINLNLVKPRDDNGKALHGADQILRFTEDEYNRLLNRAIARDVWKLPDDANHEFAHGWSRFQKNGTSALSGYLRFAMAASREKTFTVLQRKDLWLDLVTHWAFAHVPEQRNIIGMLHVHDLITNPETTLAREVRNLLQMGLGSKNNSGKLKKLALRALTDIQINRHHLDQPVPNAD
jgi:hypothetical protein